MRLRQRLIYQGLNELELKYNNSSCDVYKERMPTLDKLILEAQDHPHALFLTDKQLNAVQVAMDWEIESLESCLSDDPEHGEDKLAQAKAVKEKIERLFK